MPYAKPQNGISKEFKAFIVTADFLILVHIGPVTQGIVK
jgi:hypothetical protein